MCVLAPTARQAGGAWRSRDTARRMPKEHVDIAWRCGEALEGAFDEYWASPRPFSEALETGRLPPAAARLFDLLSPDILWSVAFTDITFRGHQGIAQGWDWLLESVHALTMQLREVEDLGDDRVLAAMDRRVQLTDSGMELLVPIFSVVTIRGGLVASNYEHETRDLAVEAAAAGSE